MKSLRALLERLPESALLALAFVLRAGFCSALSQRFYQTDEWGFSEPALQWAQTGLIGTHGHAGFEPPVPAVFFGSFYRWAGPSHLWPRLGQAAVATLGAFAIGRLARRWSGSLAAGRAALLIAAVYPFFIYYSGMLMSETIYASACAGGLALLALALDDGKALTAAGAGLLLAAAALTRIEGAGAGGVVWAAALVLCVLRRFSWKAWAAGALAFALPLLGWAARNKARTGHLALDAHGGITLVHGTILYDLCERFDTAVAMNQAAKQAWFQDIQKLPEDEQSAAYAHAAFEFMREHPRQTVVQWGKKFVSFWRFYPRMDKVYYENSASRPDVGVGRLGLVAVSLLFEPWLIILGAAGFWLLRKKPVTLPLLAFVASSTAVHMLVVSMMRYRLPVMPVMIASTAAVLAAILGVKAQLSPRNDSAR